MTTTGDPRQTLRSANLELRDLCDVVRGLGTELLTSDEVLDLVYGPAVALLRAESDLEQKSDENPDRALEALDRVRHAELLVRLPGEALQATALLTPAADLLFGIRAAIAQTDAAWGIWTRGEHRPVRPRRAEA